MGILEKLFGPSRDTLMQTLSRDTAMQYSYQPNPSFLEVLEDFDIFRQGRNPKVKHLFSVQENMEVSVKIFDYRYTTGHGKKRKDQWQTIVLLTSNKLQLSPFRIFPKHVFSGIEKFFGGQDIDISYDPLFNEKFIIKSVYPDQVHQQFNAPFRKLVIDTLDVELEAMNYFIVLNLRGLLKCHTDYYDAYYHRIFEYYEALLKS